MSEAPPSPGQEALRRERLESYKKVWKWFLRLGWPAAVFVLWLGGRIINGLHARIVELEARIASLQTTEKAP